METRTGAGYVGFTGTYCPEDEGGCGQLLRSDEWEPDLFPPTEHTLCLNCNHRPVAHVTVTSADAIAS